MNPRTRLLGALVLALGILAWLARGVPASAQPPSSPAAGSFGPKTKLKPYELQLLRRYPAVAGEIRPENIYRHLEALSGAKSRVVGYEGERQAANYVRQQFQEIFGQVEEETFRTAVPVDRGGRLVVEGREYGVRALWPNLVRTSQLPRNGLNAPLIYAGRGALREFTGRQINGSIVLVEFNSSSDWLNAPRLGAAAVIFVEPDTTMRGEAESKFMGIPVAIPRFWISKHDAAQLIPLLQRQESPTARLYCDMRWDTVEARNFIGKIPGNPNSPLKDQVIVLEAYYDAMSMVPSLAPGGESACSISALLELARQIKKFRPAREVWFLATSAHFLGLSGIKAYLQNHIDEFQAVSFGEKLSFVMARYVPFLFAIPAILRFALVLAVLGACVYGIVSAFKRNAPGHAFMGVLALVLLPLLLGSQDYQRASNPRRPPEIYLFCGLDISSNTKGVGIFYKGYYYDIREDIQNKFSDIARVTRENSEKIATVFGLDPKVIFADGVNPIEGKNWRNFFPGKIALDAEVWSLAGARGVSFASIDDVRPFVDTPFDTLDHVNVDNVTLQTKTLACLIDHILNDTNSPGEINALRMPITEASQFSRMGLQGGFATVKGRVVRFDLKESFIPSVPVPRSLAVITNPNKTFMGVRGPLVQTVDEKGRFEFNGIPPLTAYYGTPRTTQVQAYHLDEDGDIDYAPDLGHTGAKAYPIDVSVTMGTKEVQCIVFRCESTSIYDFVDPQSLKTLSEVNVYDGATNAEPRMYGMAVAHPEKFQAVVEDAAVFFAQPGFAIKVVMGAGPAAIRFVLINSTYERDPYANGGQGKLVRKGVPEGIGYQLGKPLQGGDVPTRIPGVTHDRSYEGTIPNIPLQVTRDMWRWDDYNIQKLAKYRIINQMLHEPNPERRKENPGLHDRAYDLLVQADQALEQRDYAKLDAFSRAAWGYEARAYPEVQTTARDVVKGVMFYLALLLPFAFFTERLLVASATLKGQICWIFGIFIMAFVVMTKIHPAFDITMSPMIVLLAFIMLALSCLVIVLITGKFEQQLKEFNKQISGVHKADIGRMSIAAAAFSLGISNMRRRKARTILTCITLVLLTFIVLSFTSVRSSIQYNVVEAPGTPRYNGIMLRTAMWEELEESSYRLLNDEFGDSRPVAPRAWFFGAQMGEQTFLTISRGDKKWDARALLGLTPQETEITRAHAALIAGRWLRPGDVYACLLVKEIADELGIDQQAVEQGTARVYYGGQPYTVVGLLDNDSFKAIKDLDQEPLTPVDFIVMQRQSQSSGTRTTQGSEAGFREYTHLEPSTVFIIPFQTLMNQGGQVRSVAINFLSAEEVTQRRLELMPRLTLNLYAGDRGRTYRYSSIGSTSIVGATTLVFPILIAALIVLNTMLGAVFERQKEIHVFSSIGLAPNHVAMLFMAESMVYAILGAMAGYVLGQGSAKIIVSMNWFEGLNLNFSSLSAVFSTLLVMAVVMLSTMYPARKASEVATPAIERTWRTPEPDGDRWAIPLPFMVTGEQAVGLNTFLGEWFQAYEEYSIGDFVTQNVTTEEHETPQGKAYRISLMAWLAPFDLGVSQQVTLDTAPTDMEDVFDLRLTIHRQSGDISNWKRVNRRFLNTLRKQFLIWRTLRTEERERYLISNEQPASA
ncbi:MAG: FtsX-like permease family protein [Armatimonadetes bacterium]|nr:FtsX-like permease family protein [Armatimonadota bacterium]